MLTGTVEKREHSIAKSDQVKVIIPYVLLVPWNSAYTMTLLVTLRLGRIAGVIPKAHSTTRSNATNPGPRRMNANPQCTEQKGLS